MKDGGGGGWRDTERILPLNVITISTTVCPFLNFIFCQGGVELGLGGVDDRWGWGRVEGHPKGTTIKFHHYIYSGLSSMIFCFF